MKPRLSATVPARAASNARRTRLVQRLLAMGLLLGAVWATGSLAQEWVYTVRPGDTFSDLVDRYLAPRYDPADLQVHNRLVDRDVLPAGTRLRIPVAWLKLQPAPARLILLVGDVQRSREDNAATEALSVGVELNAGDTLRTGSDGVATIEFADGSRLLLQPDSAITFDTLSALGATGMVDTGMRLHGGRTNNVVEPQQNPDSRYQIVTPPAVAAVRGTEFRVGYEPTAELMTVEVEDGAIGVSAQGVTREVPAGFGSATRLGEPPGEPATLLPPPDVSQLPARVPLTQVSFTWPAVTGAEAYRAEVFSGEQFLRPQRAVTVDTAAVAFTALAPAAYQLRLRAVDGAGLAGEEARHEFTVDPPPAAPALIAPPDLVDWSRPAVTLLWSAPPGAQAFRLQVARDPTFREPLVDAALLRAIDFTLPHDLPPGHYYWRVAAIGAHDEQGPFATAHEFTVRSLPAAPAVRVAMPSADEVLFRWDAVSNASRYRVLVARDPRLRDIVLDVDTEATSLAMATPGWGRFFFRAQSIGDAAVAGAPGRVRVLQVPPWLPAPQVLLLFVPLLALVPLHVRLRRSP